MMSLEAGWCKNMSSCVGQQSEDGAFKAVIMMANWPHPSVSASPRRPRLSSQAQGVELLRHQHLQRATGQDTEPTG